MNIFLSYYAGDRAFLGKLVKFLEQHDFRAYPKHLKAFFGAKGLHDPDELDEYFRDEDLAIILLSRSYMKDRWLRGEIHALLTLESKLRPAFVLPLFLKGISDEEIPEECFIRPHIDFREKTDEQGFSDLIHHLGKLAAKPRLSVFVSHSSRDNRVAEALSNLLKAAFRLTSDEILCTSVTGHRLPLGAAVNDTLRRKIREAKVFVCVATENSMGMTERHGSFYVAVELGARWGMKRHFAILANDAGVDALRAPINQFNALMFDDHGQVQQFIREIGPVLGKEPESADKYARAVEELVNASRAVAAA